MSSPVYEVNKEIDVNSIMQLVDINGSMNNFQSEFVVSLKDPSKTILVAIVNQDQLDNGEINFQPTEGGVYSKRVTFQGDHLNHFIALKKNDQGEEDVKCNVMIRLKQLEAKEPEMKEMKEMKRIENKDEKHVNFKTPIESVLSSQQPSQYSSQQIPSHPSFPSHPSEEEARLSPFRDELSPEARTILKNKLSTLRQSPDYNKASSENEYKKEVTNEEIEKRVKKEYPQLSFKDRLQADPYYLVGIVSMVLFLCIIAVKFMKKN